MEFTIPGRPFAKKRARGFYNQKLGRSVTVNDPDNRSFESKVAAIARPFFPVPIEGPVKLRIVAVFAVPASWSKRKQAEAVGQYHTQRPDSDNIEKACSDGLSRIAWRDDCQVADARCVKRWGRYDETFVQVEAL